jgi:Na+/proline symporter
MLHKAKKLHHEKRSLAIARGATAVLGFLAVLVAAQGISVLYLFLVVDLLAAATIIPVIAGLWLNRYGKGALQVASLAGLAVGIPFFPGPDYSSLITASWWPGAGLSGDTLCLLSFSLAFGVSSLVILTADRMARVKA